MKNITKMSRAVGLIEKLARVLSKYVGDKLGKPIETMPIFTLTTGKRCYGYTTTYAKWKTQDGGKHEIGISAEYWEDTIELVDTITHEFIHIWNLENNIQDVSRGGYYHNKKFKDACDKCGLGTFHDDGIGWNTNGNLNDELMEIACNFDSEKMTVEAPPAYPVMGSPNTNGTAGQTATVGGKKKTVWRNECPNCKAVARTTKKIPLICGTCMIKMVDDD